MRARKPVYRRLDKDKRRELRLKVVDAALKGNSISEVARCFNVSRNAVCVWTETFQKYGFVEEKKCGPKKNNFFKLDQTVCQDLRASLVESLPDRFPELAPHLLWSKYAVWDYIVKVKQVNYSVNSVGNILKRWGFAAPDPQAEYTARDPIVMHRWMRKVYADVQLRARWSDMLIWWLADKPFSVDPGYRMLSCVSNMRKHYFRVYPAAERPAGVVEDTIERLHREEKRRILLLLSETPETDRAGLEAWEQRQDRTVSLIWLPFAGAQAVSTPSVQLGQTSVPAPLETAAL